MFGSQRPDRRVTVDVHHWIQLKAGDKFEAWMAGPGVGVHVHFQHGSKACRNKLSDGELKCEFCSAGLKPTYRCYFPLFDRAATKRVTAVNQDYDEMAKEVPLHGAVVVTKKKIWGSPIVILDDPKREPWVARNDTQRGPVLLQPWLLQVWHDPILTEWVTKHQVVELPAGSYSRVSAEARYIAEKQKLEEKAKREKEEAKLIGDLMSKKLAKLREQNAREAEQNGKVHK